VTGRTSLAATGRRAPLLALATLVGVLVVACGGPTSSTSPVAPSGAASSSPSAASPSSAGSSPSAGPSGSADGSAAGPKPTSWPGDVVEAVVILGKADLDIQRAGGDLGAAAAYQDLEAMWGAADGLATLIEHLQPQVDRIRDYPVTAPAARAYDAAFPDMLAGAKGIRDAIKAGDSAGLTAAVGQLAAGTAKYAEARRLIGPLVEPALLMQRILVK
jgi:hypothetical protein